MLNKVIILFVLSFGLPASDLSSSSSGSVEQQELQPTKNSIEIGGYNVRQSGDGGYLIDIYASNRQPIAGIQFELLGDGDFQILDVFGGRAAHSGFSFYNGKGGIVLAFSLQGKAVSPVEDVYKKVNPLFTLKVKKNIDNVDFNLKTLVSSQKGIKLDSYFVPLMIN